jgi:hypothetical protein
MNTLRKIHTGLGLALLTSLALVAGSASADTADTSFDDASLGEATEALEVDACITCTISGPGSTGRQYATMCTSIRGGQVVCTRTGLGTIAPADEASCHSRRDELGCQIVL